ncbi:MAG: threonylcarbamoyl-AMP synthase [Planctomycetes bacterium]|nr:threonylcarbamoyl-AMP synthase [Planctomycetota bacterium]
MSTEVATIDRERAGFDDLIGRAAEIMRQGGIVGFPTETVYGIGACVTQSAAVSRLRDIKQRPTGKAFTVHLGSRDAVKGLVPDRSPLADRLIRKALPGPVTLILDADEPSAAPGAEGLDSAALEAMFYDRTIGLRVPDDDVAALLLRAVGSPVVAGSANTADAVPARDGKDVVKGLDGLIDLVLDAGPTKYSDSSTIVRVRHNEYELVRTGVFDARTIARLAMLRILFVCTGNTCRSPMAEGLAKNVLAERLECEIAGLPQRGVAVSSAGTGGGFGGVSEHAVAVMTRRGIDISGHGSKSLTPGLIHQADHIFAMTHSHADAIRAMVPGAEERTVLLVENESVFDPIGGGEDDYARCARVIEQGVRHRLQEFDV